MGVGEDRGRREHQPHSLAQVAGPTAVAVANKNIRNAGDRAGNGMLS